MTGLRVFALDSLPDEPWRNGGGRTRTISVWPAGELADDASGGVGWQWRLSVATIERDGDFSSFAGVDRISMLVSEGGLAVHMAGGAPLTLSRPGQSITYPGESPARSHLLDAEKPVSLLNVMTRRDASRASVRAVSGPATLSAQALAVLVMSGCWQLTATSPLTGMNSVALGAGHGAFSEPDAAGWQAESRWQLEPLTPGGLLAAIEIDSTAP